MVKTKNGIISTASAITKVDLLQRNTYFFLLVPLILLLLFIERYVTSPVALSDGFSQNLFRLFRGDYRIDPQLSYQAPIVWIFLNAYIAFVIGGFPFSDVETMILIKSRSKLKWWLSKCISLTAIVVTTYIFICFSVAAVTLLGGHTDLSEFDKNSLAALLLPFGVSLACSFIQAVMNLWLKPVFGFLAVASCQIVSTFIHSPLLFTSYSQLMRTVLSKPNGITFSLAFFVITAIVLVCAVSGAVIVRRLDIVGIKE